MCFDVNLTDLNEMNFQLAEVQFHSESNCFVLLHFSKGLAPAKSAKIEIKTTNDEIIYVSGYVENSVLKSSQRPFLQVNSIFACKLKNPMQPGHLVLWRVMDNVPKCLRVYVEPETVDDWEIIESNANAIEEQLMSQMHIVYKNLIFPMWIDGSLCVFLKVVLFEPYADCVELVENSEVAVKPKTAPAVKPVENGHGHSKIVENNVDSKLKVHVNGIDVRRPMDLPFASLDPESNNRPLDSPLNSLQPNTPRQSVSPKVRKSSSPGSRSNKEVLPKRQPKSSPIRSLWNDVKEIFSPSTETKPKEQGSVGPMPTTEQPEESNFQETLVDYDDCNVFQYLIDDIVDYFELNCIAGNSGKCHAIIEGPAMSGKTYAAQMIRRRITDKFGAHSRYLDCKKLSGKSLVFVSKHFKSIVDDCCRHEPSLVALDDLDQLCSNGSVMKQLAPGADIQFARLAKALVQFLEYIWTARKRVLVVATCNSRQKLHDFLISVRGKHYFKKYVEIPALDSEQRTNILKSMFARRQILHVSDSVVQKLVKATEGFAAGDLDRVVDRVSRASSTKSQRSTQIVEDDINWSLVDFKSINLHNAQVNKEILQSSWSDFGGLNDVKREIIRTLEWPIKYNFIFSSLKVRLARGVLLYGPTGTGKTLLASVVAKECGLNFIVVKGAELLSKYIGASEQGVRDTFARARAAKPSLILFDEFEALAPRRGHDSTGVTDRVVNQLLTELDGVEALEGVFVLATTSRPDLIDPAFLRPGRIDKCLFCSMPTFEDRKEILECLIQRINVADDVDLARLASDTYRFSGADLKALLYNAQLAAVHVGLKHNGVEHRLRNFESRKVNVVAYFPKLGSVPVVASPDQKAEIERQIFLNVDEYTINEAAKMKVNQSKGILVSNEHLLKALKETKPSVSEAELNRLQNIYTKFTNSSKTHLPDVGLNLLEVGQRSTLA